VRCSPLKRRTASFASYRSGCGELCRRTLGRGASRKGWREPTIRPGLWQKHRNNPRQSSGTHPTRRRRVPKEAATSRSQMADRCGFPTEERIRHCFVRHLGAALVGGTVSALPAGRRRAISKADRDRGALPRGPPPCDTNQLSALKCLHGRSAGPAGRESHFGCAGLTHRDGSCSLRTASSLTIGMAASAYELNSYRSL
jgi:hypothetical protein